MILILETSNDREWPAILLALEMFLFLKYPMTENRLRSDSRLGWLLFLTRPRD
jgi:hypothetical protein